MAKFEMASGGTYIREEILSNGFSIIFEVAFPDFAVNSLDNGIGFDFYAESDKIVESIRDSGQSAKYRYIPGEGFKREA